jgi:hypothetical protein
MAGFGDAVLLEICDQLATLAADHHLGVDRLVVRLLDLPEGVIEQALVGRCGFESSALRSSDATPGPPLEGSGRRSRGRLLVGR